LIHAARPDTQAAATTQVTANLFDHVAEANIVAMNQYVGGLLAVIKGMEPKLALAQAEAAAE
jgi:hypothetical protein